jgi:uncharacterized membrane protein YeaQ/YmgE (transglycosylase-associated protein family)
VGLFIIGMLVWGMAIGWSAQMLLGRGRTAKTRDWGQAMIAGVVGSFVGGALGSILRGEGFQFQIGGIIGSIVGAVIVLAIWYAIAARRA